MASEALLWTGLQVRYYTFPVISAKFFLQGKEKGIETGGILTNSRKYLMYRSNTQLKLNSFKQYYF